MTIPSNKIAGELVAANDYNPLAAHVNMIFGDAVPGSQPSTDPAIVAAMKYGWGQTAPVMNITGNGSGQNGDLITAEQWNSLVDRLQIGLINTQSAPPALIRFKVGKDYIPAPGAIRSDTVYASHFNDLLELTRVLDASKNVLVPEETVVVSSVTDLRPAPWRKHLTSSVDYDFGSYDRARYFFNSGGTLSLEMSASAGTTAGYTIFAGIYEKLGQFTLDLDSSNSTGTGAISTNKGFYDVGTSETLLMTVSSNGGGPYGGYGG